MKFNRNYLETSEAQISAQFYHVMNQLGFSGVYLEVPMPSRHHRSGSFRVDAAVVYEDQVVCAIEFKRKGRSKPGPQSRQIRAYEDCGFPYLFCFGMKGTDELVREVCKLLKAGGWKPRYELAA